MKILFLKKLFASAILVFFFVMTLVGIALPVYAQQATNDPCVSGSKNKTEYCLLEPIVVDGKEVKSVNISTYVQDMFKIGIGLAGVFAVFMIIWGGLEYVSTDAINKKTDGKEKIEGALWGLALALGSFLILNTINPELLKFSGGLEPITASDLAKRESYKDPSLTPALIEELRIGDEARKNNASIEALRKRAKDLRNQADEAYSAGDTKEAERLNNLAAKTESEADKLYVTSVITLRYDNAVREIMEKGDSKSTTKYKEMNAFFDQQIQLLTNSGAPQSEINLLKAKKMARNQQLIQALDMYEIQKLLVSDAQGNRGKAIDIALGFEKESKDIISKIDELDPNEAQLFKEFTNKNLKAINPLIAYRTSCPNDFTTDWGKIGQKIVEGAVKGVVGGAIIGGTAGTFTVPAVGTGIGATIGGAVGGVGGAISHGLTEIAYGQKIPCQAK
ncbi:hypothetical protein EPO17_01940 [Patescibacteria group bacterium]|nr:MAG: hypothetical protein EPO17_01940 [Patescibacteria group bacterium]